MAGERALEYAKRAGLNEYFLAVVEVTLGGVVFQIFGSMSWTVAHVRNLEWEDIHKAYVSITGDQREDVDHEAATNVVSGELQRHWADYHSRDDLKKIVDEQQEKRIAFAMQEPPATPAGKPSAGNSRTTRSGDMTKKKKAPSKKKKKAPDKEEVKVPQKGASGHAAKLIADGKTDRAKITAAVEKAFPDVKNVAPAISYAARCLDVTLT